MSVAGAASTITYQGQLQYSGQPFTGTPGMAFRLFDSLTEGSQIGDPESFTAVPIEDGLFQVELDFGAGAFDGGERWLEIEVSGDILQPRQKITGSPWSHQALSVAAGSVGSDQIAAGAVGENQIDGSQIQLRINDSCAAGDYVAAINEDGSVVCQTDQNTLYTAGAGLNLANEAFTVDDAYFDNNYLSLSGGTITGDLDVDGEIRANASGSSSLSYVRFGDGTARLFHDSAFLSDIFRLRGAAQGLDVDGGIRTSGDFSYRNSISRTKSLPASAFQPQDPARWRSNFLLTYLYPSDSTSGSYLAAPVQLPNGATIDTIRCYVYDNHSTGNLEMRMRLYRTKLFADAERVGAEVLAGATLYTSGASTKFRERSALNIGELVDNDTHVYQLWISIDPDESSFRLSFHGCRVEYSVDSPAP